MAATRSAPGCQPQKEKAGVGSRSPDIVYTELIIAACREKSRKIWTRKFIEMACDSKLVTGQELADADDGQEASALWAFFAITEEKVAAAGGAQAVDEDVGSTDSGAKKLGAIGFAEIEEDVFWWRLVAGRHPVQPLDGIGLVTGAEFVEPFGGFGELGKKLSGNFGADFVAATANGWAYGGKQIGRVGFELHLQPADGFDDDALESAAPAGMNGGDGALLGIDEENGNAVSGLDAQEQAGAVGNGGIALARLGRRDVEKVDDIGMDLFKRNELQVGSTEGGLEAAAVFEDVLFGVPIREAEIENLFAALIADAAKFGAEAVDEPGESCKGGDLEDLYAADLAFDPVRVGAVGRDRQEFLSYRGAFAGLAFGPQCFRGRHSDTSIIAEV